MIFQIENPRAGIRAFEVLAYLEKIPPFAMRQRRALYLSEAMTQRLQIKAETLRCIETALG